MPRFTDEQKAAILNGVVTLRDLWLAPPRHGTAQGAAFMAALEGIETAFFGPPPEPQPVVAASGASGFGASGMTGNTGASGGPIGASGASGPGASGLTGNTGASGSARKTGATGA